MKRAQSTSKLVAGRFLAGNVVWNLAGTGLPLIVAAVAVPQLIRRMGTDRFGVLTLAWVLIGYFGLFDFGLGRALTKLVAEMLGEGRGQEVASLCHTSLLMMFLLGCLGTVVLCCTSSWLVHSLIRIPVPIQRETQLAFFVLGASLPIVTLSTGLRGFLEAHQRFGLSNLVRIPLGVLTYLGPVVIARFSISLVPIVLVLAFGRVLACGAQWVLSVHIHSALARGIDFRREHALTLWRFGGWMTVSNIISPLMVSMDRFLIGAIVSISAVAYYATPSEIITKLLIVPTAIVGVLFPAFSSHFGQHKERTSVLFSRGLKYTFLIIFPFSLIVIAFAHEGLTKWVGLDFANHSARVLQYLAIGVFFGSLSQIPFALVQGAGRPDITGILHLIELPGYIALLWFLVRFYGIDGAAIAWTVRVVSDAAMLFIFSKKLLPQTANAVWKTAAAATAAVSVCLLAVVISNVLLKALFVVSCLLLYAIVAWCVAMSQAEREFVWSFRTYWLGGGSLAHGRD